MKKILLCFEDYGELNTTEVYLKKIGFDVVGISNEFLLVDQIISFNPDIIVAFGKSHRVSSVSIGAKLKENRKFNGKVVLVFSSKPSPQEMIRLRMDAMMEQPLEPIKLIHALAKLSKLDTVVLIEKLRKATLHDPLLAEKIKITGSAEVESAEEKKWVIDRQRVQGYEKIIKGETIDSNKTTFQKSEIKERQIELKKSWNFEELEALDALKRSFAEALFKKNK